MNRHIEATEKSGKEFYLNFVQKGKEVVMLNLLKFKPKADYANFESIRIEKDITGQEAYDIYTNNTLGELKRVGSEILFYGESKSFLIGPDFEKWDAILLIKHKSVLAFMEFAKSDIYLNNVGHRKAGLEDSRLLPTTEIKSYT
ncbi:DUF1330 domain-containing protein [uncultured Algibacter sp.]|uniref:DUF1330 domain-containing protein n=1 Tax=uncultured Algibacter sp. TaxID=298659 RepID=UPI002634E294|nr:DUF1330 domain-containing protein [uncultured Algibacter sp.]